MEEILCRLRICIINRKKHEGGEGLLCNKHLQPTVRIWGWVQWSASFGGSSEAWFYLHDNDESKLGSQNMPKLHGVGVLLLMARWVAVVTISRKKDQRSFEFPADFHTYLIQDSRLINVILQSRSKREWCNIFLYIYTHTMHISRGLVISKCVGT